MLVLSLVIMGVATFLSGVMPTYASIATWLASETHQTDINADDAVEREPAEARR
jgi:hypothetical protein